MQCQTQAYVCRKRKEGWQRFCRENFDDNKVRQLLNGPESQTHSHNRHDFYQTGTTIHASLYLKKISKADAKVAFSSPTTISVDLPTADKTRYKETIPLYGLIDPAKSNFKVLGTKLELSLAKADGQGWPVLRADDRPTGEIIQTGKAGRAS